MTTFDDSLDALDSLLQHSELRVPTRVPDLLTRIQQEHSVSRSQARRILIDLIDHHKRLDSGNAHTVAPAPPVPSVSRLRNRISTDFTVSTDRNPQGKTVQGSGFAENPAGRPTVVGATPKKPKEHVISTDTPPVTLFDRQKAEIEQKPGKPILTSKGVPRSRIKLPYCSRIKLPYFLQTLPGIYQVTEDFIVNASREGFTSREIVHVIMRNREKLLVPEGLPLDEAYARLEKTVNYFRKKHNVKTRRTTSYRQRTTYTRRDVITPDPDEIPWVTRWGSTYKSHIVVDAGIILEYHDYVDYLFELGWTVLMIRDELLPYNVPRHNQSEENFRRALYMRVFQARRRWLDRRVDV